MYGFHFILALIFVAADYMTTNQVDKAWINFVALLNAVLAAEVYTDALHHEEKKYDDVVAEHKWANRERTLRAYTVYGTSLVILVAATYFVPGVDIGNWALALHLLSVPICFVLAYWITAACFERQTFKDRPRRQIVCGRDDLNFKDKKL